MSLLSNEPLTVIGSLALSLSLSLSLSLYLSLSFKNAFFILFSTSEEREVSEM